MIEFSHLLMTNSQPVPKQLLWNPELADLRILWNSPKQTKLTEKFELPQKRRFLPPGQPPFIN